MASRSVSSWYNGLPSWIRPGRTSLESHELSDNGQSGVSSMISASTRTKRLSRAEAMRRLEGRKFSDMTMRSAERSSPKENSGRDSESEDDDPWTDPWQWQRPPRPLDVERVGSPAASSIYSDAQELRTDSIVMRSASHGSRDESSRPTTSAAVAGALEKQTILSTYQIDDQEKSATCDAATSRFSRQRTLAAQVRDALRESYSTETTSSLRRPPKAYRVPSRAFSLTPSDSPYRISWLQSRQDCVLPQAEKYDMSQHSWRGASRSYDPTLRSGSEIDELDETGQSWRRHRTATSHSESKALGWSAASMQSPRLPKYTFQLHNSKPDPISTAANEILASRWHLRNCKSSESFLSRTASKDASLYAICVFLVMFVGFSLLIGALLALRGTGPADA